MKNLLLFCILVFVLSSCSYRHSMVMRQEQRMMLVQNKPAKQSKIDPREISNYPISDCIKISASSEKNKQVRIVRPSALRIVKKVKKINQFIKGGYTHVPLLKHPHFPRAVQSEYKTTAIVFGILAVIFLILGILLLILAFNTLNLSGLVAGILGIICLFIGLAWGLIWLVLVIFKPEHPFWIIFVLIVLFIIVFYLLF